MKKLDFFQLLFFIVTSAISYLVGYIFYFSFAIIVRPQFGENREETLKLRDAFCIEKGLENLLISIFVALILSIIFFVIFKSKKKTLLLFFISLLICNVGNYYGITNYYYGMISEINYIFPE